MAEEDKKDEIEEKQAAETGELPKLTVREIEKMNVPKLKEAALQYSGRIEGVHGMDKGKLIRALKEINSLPLQEPKRASKIDRTSIKQKIKNLKKERDQAVKMEDRNQLHRVRRRTKALRRNLVRNM